MSRTYYDRVVSGYYLIYQDRQKIFRLMNNEIFFWAENILGDPYNSSVRGATGHVMSDWKILIQIFVYGWNYSVFAKLSINSSSTQFKSILTPDEAIIQISPASQPPQKKEVA